MLVLTSVACWESDAAYSAKLTKNQIARPKPISRWRDGAHVLRADEPHVRRRVADRRADQESRELRTAQTEVESTSRRKKVGNLASAKVVEARPCWRYCDPRHLLVRGLGPGPRTRRARRPRVDFAAAARYSGATPSTISTLATPRTRSALARRPNVIDGEGDVRPLS